MGTRFKKFSDMGPLSYSHDTSADYLGHEDEPLDTHATYVATGTGGTDAYDDTYNLFDDSPAEDKRWLTLTRRFLKQLKHRQ